MRKGKRKRERELLPVRSGAEQEKAVTETRGLKCPRCECPHVPVIETRETIGGRLRRRRECRHCKRRFTTYELTTPTENLEEKKPPIRYR